MPADPMPARVDVEAARKLCDEATPGPWTWDELFPRDLVSSSPYYSRIIQTDVSAGSRDDRAFIAAARTLLPAALDEIERLRGELATGPDGLPQHLRMNMAKVREMADRIAELEAERDAMAEQYAAMTRLAAKHRDEGAAAIAQRDEARAERDRMEPVVDRLKLTGEEFDLLDGLSRAFDGVSRGGDAEADKSGAVNIRCDEAHRAMKLLERWLAAHHVSAPDGEGGQS